jgi:hypothetical protein
MKIILNKKFAVVVTSTLLMFFLCLDVHAQKTAFIMSSMGNLAGTNNTGLAMNFKSDAGCLDVQNGLAVLSGVRGDGQFSMSCEVKMNYNTLGIKMYPNPVQNFTKVKFVNTPPLTEVFNLSIWSTDGVLVTTKKETGYNIFQGMTIDLTNIHAGTYVLKIESASFVDAIKFVKAN